MHVYVFRRSILAVVALTVALVAALSSCAQARQSPPAQTAGFAYGGFVTSAKTQPSAVAGNSMRVSASVTSNADTRAVVDVEIYSPDHTKLYQQSFEDQALNRDKARQYDVAWNIPSGIETSSAIVKIGVFTPGWAQLSHWNDDAATVTIQPAVGHSAVSNGGVQLLSQTAGIPYVTGANLPWYNWSCDFGCGSSKGVSDPSVTAALEPVFGTAQSGGFQVIRWWMFEGSPWQITTDANGAPSGLNPNVYADVDAAVNLAAEHNVAFDFVLFAAPTAIPSSWITDPAQRAQLASVLAPLFARYANNPHVWSWEVFNEPEYDIWQHKIDAAPVQATVKAIAGSVHQNSSAYVTVGSAMLDGLDLWTGLGLDYYEAHWYDYMSSGDWCAVCSDYASLQAKYNLDAPLIIGEFYAGNSNTALRRDTYFATHGFAGAWPWSLLPDHTDDKMAIDMAAAAAFATGQRDSGPPLSGNSGAAIRPGDELLRNAVFEH